MNYTDFQEDKGLIINIFVTGKCNARCQECINQTITNNSNLNLENLEVDPERDLHILRNILQKHNDTPATIAFYGGEPLLEAHRFIQIIKGLDNSGYSSRIKYMVYTNGENLVDFLKNHSEIARRIWLYAVSIDGDENQHNRFRLGTDLKRIRKNLSFLRENYQSNVLMWATLREAQSLLNCFEEFMRLYNSGLVNHFFWHWLETQEEFKDFPTYFKNYTDDLETVVDNYLSHLQKGTLLPIAHLNELILYLIAKKQRSHTACGAELSTNYDLVGGEILACVDLPFEQGKELKKNPDRLLSLKESLGCRECAIHFYCGGRCPVQILYGTKLRTRQYCELLRAHVKIVKNRLPEIQRILLEKKISLHDIYDRSAFIVRYTDVTP
ncbi:MAG: 4Fe-4S cluster-binding domain-containing protein [candidate division WOR-3 bacterium]